MKPLRAPISRETLVARIKRIPALPRAVHDLNAAISDESVQTDRVVQAVSVDQALTATALKIANSSFYGVSGRVVSLRDAVQILGLQTLSAAVMTAAVMARFDRSTCAAFDFDGTWLHALATGKCAQMVAATRGVDECAAYTAGLLHDIGRLALAANFPAEYTECLAWAAEHDAGPIEAEREILGIDHAVVGGMIVRHWRLAPALVEAVCLHHDMPDQGHGPLLDVLHLADNITHALDLSQTPDDMVPSMSIAAWDRMKMTGAELEQVFDRLEGSMRGLDAGMAA